jgi:hypothetical protein
MVSSYAPRALGLKVSTSLIATADELIEYFADVFWQILLQKSFCEVGLKFSDPWVQRLNNDVGDHVAKRQTRRRFW